jgi:hypothetical protein
MSRVLRSLAAAGVAFGIAFVVEFFAYMSWAEREYPHNNSMAGLSAFAYGLPVGGLCAAVVFCLVFFDSRWQGNIFLLFLRYVARFGLLAGAVIAFGPVLSDGITWPGEWEVLLLRMVIWAVICGGIAFGLGWLYHIAFRYHR